MTNINGRFARQLPHQKPQKPEAKEAQESPKASRNNPIITAAYTPYTEPTDAPGLPDPQTPGAPGIYNPYNNTGNPGLPDPQAGDPINVTFANDGKSFNYSPADVVANNTRHFVLLGGNNTNATVTTGNVADSVILGGTTPADAAANMPSGGADPHGGDPSGAPGPFPGQFPSPMNPDPASGGPNNNQPYLNYNQIGNNNNWTVNTQGGSDSVLINTGYHNTATINLGDDNDSVSTSLEQLFSTFDGNSYTIDGGDGADGVNFGNLPNTTDFSLIKSKQLPDDTWELTIPSSDGGFNTVILSNIESISYSLYTPSDTPVSAGSVEDMIQLSLADFLAMTTQL